MTFLWTIYVASRAVVFVASARGLLRTSERGGWGGRFCFFYYCISFCHRFFVFCCVFVICDVAARRQQAVALCQRDKSAW